MGDHGPHAVIVLGAGAVGLTTAIRLLEAGCDVRVVTAAPIETTTSYLTAGIWFPTHVGPPGRVAGWGRRTFEVPAGPGLGPGRGHARIPRAVPAAARPAGLDRLGRAGP
jgi:glycine/D-amino acid oxidase-like deaminating enzyme